MTKFTPQNYTSLDDFLKFSANNHTGQMLKQVQNDSKIHVVTLNLFQGLSNFKTTQKNKQIAFTLAEVLITLVVIGVVAAITVPVGMSNIQQKVKQERISNIRHKFSKATDAMMAASGMNGYASTMDFVQEFAKHLKISKICDNGHIADCWPTSNVKLVSYEKEYDWNMADTITSKTLQMPNNFNVDWDNTVGIITNDGTGMILSYNKKCDKSITGGLRWSGDNSSSNTCVAAVFDWNGGKKPNTFGSTVKNADIYSINAGGLGQVCAVEINGTCFTPVQVTSSISNSTTSYLSKLGIGNSCKHYSTGLSCVSTDYWAGAAEICGGTDNLPTIGDLQALANKMYTNGEFTNKELANAMGISAGMMTSRDGLFSIWTKNEISSGMAAAHVFTQSKSNTRTDSITRNFSWPLALCKI